MKFVSIYPNGKFFDKRNERYFHYLIQNGVMSGEVKLIDKKTIKKFVRSFFRAGRVTIQYRELPQTVDCRSGYLQLDIFQIYGEGAQVKPPYKTSNPFALVSMWDIGEVAWAELKENGCIEFTPISRSSTREE